MYWSSTSSKQCFLHDFFTTLLYWNNLKLSDCEVIEGTNANMGGQNLYAVFMNSFIEGLNPLECLLHAILGWLISFLKMLLSLGH
jgi:hypothetical protein